MDALRGDKRVESSPRAAGSLSQHVMSSLRGTEHHETVLNGFKRSVLTRDGATVDGVQNMTQVIASQTQDVCVFLWRQVRGEGYG